MHRAGTFRKKGITDRVRRTGPRLSRASSTLEHRAGGMKPGRLSTLAPYPATCLDLEDAADVPERTPHGNLSRLVWVWALAVIAEAGAASACTDTRVHRFPHSGFAPVPSRWYSSALTASLKEQKKCYAERIFCSEFLEFPGPRSTPDPRIDGG